MKHLVALLLVSSAAIAATPAIGVITANGSFRLEGSRVWGNSTLFEGARLETTDASSELALSNGVKIQLAVGSAARVWKGRLELQRGTGQVSASSPFQVNAGGIAVEGTRYRVGVQGARLEVAALTGGARVLDGRRALIAAVPTGRNASFAMQQAVTRTGCLVYKAPGFLLQVDGSQEVLQLAGGPLAQNVGNRVDVTGTPSVTPTTIAGATGALAVTALSQRAAGGCLTAAAGLNAQTTVPTTPVAQPGVPASPAATAAKVGMSTGAKIGIIGAVAGGGAGAALALGGKKSSTSP